MRKANITWSAKQLAKSVEKGTITFDNVIQRGLCWDLRRKSLLINSMVLGYPIPPFYARKTEAGYDMLDGKQRCNTIAEYLRDGFALSDVPLVQSETSDSESECECEGFDMSGLKFSELPEYVQDIIKDYSLTVYYFDDISDDEVAEMFKRLNNGKSLSQIELTRVHATSLPTIRTLGTHPIFSRALSEKAINGYANEDVVIKSWIVLNDDEPSLETKVIRPIMEQALITESDAETLTKCFDYLLKTYQLLVATGDAFDKKVAKRIITRTHMISLMPTIVKAMAVDSVESFVLFVRSFFSGTRSATQNDAYNNASSGCCAQKTFVTTRIREIAKAYTSGAWRNVA